MAKYKSYSEKLKDPRWQRKRLEIMERDEFTCRYCRSKENTLNVHHRHYRKGAEPWDYDDNCFVTLCQNCHEQAEILKSSICGKIGSNKRRDESIARICNAISQDPEELTFFGWAAESLADAIQQFENVRSDYNNNPEDASISMSEMRGYIHDCIENLHRALFRISETYPEQ
jgi:hypothetical protein